MDKTSVLNSIGCFRGALEKKHISVNQIILFGSWAKNVQHEGSDIDLMVVSKDFEGKGYWERLELLSDAIYEVLAPIEATAVTPQEWEKKESFVCEYARSGEVILA